MCSRTVLSIPATTGNIIEYETDGDGYEGSHHKNSADNSGSKYIGRSRAKEIALAKAGLTASQIHDYEIELDDGEYEIDFKYQNMEYEVDIDAKTGSQVQMFRIINTDNGEMVI